MTANFKGLTIANCLILLLLLVLLGCGTGNVGVVDPGQVADDRTSTGVTVSGFEVLRYNQEGFTDPALNGTIGVDVASEDGLTAVTVSVTDPAAMRSVIVNINYDSARTHPERAEFHNLLGGESEVLSAAFLDSPGVAGLGEAAIRDFQPGEFAGEFVTVYFSEGPGRNVSAIGDVHSSEFGVAKQFLQPDGGMDNLFAEWTDTTANVSWTAGWHCGDGDQNSETNAADLVPLALFFFENTGTNWPAVVADYDLNTEVNASDIARIGLFFGELTSSYLVEAADNDGSGRVEVSRVAWGDALDSTGGAAGELKSAFDYWEVNFDSATTFTYAQLSALDVDGDGFARVYVSPITLAGANIDQTGAESFIDIEVGEPTPVAKSLIISGYDIEIEGATDGSGGSIFDGNAGTPAPAAAIVENANATASFSLNAISGTFEGVNFTATSLATGQGMTQAHYDNALASARAQVSWTFSHGGAGGFRRTTDWINLDSGNPSPAPFTIVGDPSGGTIFPDDDPESTDAQAEGTLATTLPFGGEGTYLWNNEVHVQVLADVAYNFTVDIEVDEAAPLLASYQVTELPLIINSPFAMQFDWGSDGDPLVYDDVDLQLVPFNPADPSVPLPGIIDFDYIESGAVNGREFSLRLTGQATIECIVPGASLQASTAYAFRFFDGTTWSSINKPEELLTTADPPPPQDLLVLPDVVDRTVNFIQIFYSDPVIRRNPFFIVDLLNGTALPEDEEAYNDALKINGDEFPIAVVPVGDPPIPTAWPQIVIGPPGGSSTQVNPNIITSVDYDGVDGIIVPVHNGNRIIVDIRVLTGPPQPGDDDEYYALKLFNADGSAVGQGTFLVPVLGIAVPGPTGVNWAINVFNREEKEFGDRAFTDRTLDSSRVGGIIPDIIWAEFADGWMFEALESAPDRPYINVHMNLSDVEPAGGEMDLNLNLRVVGLTPQDTYLAIHEVVRDDYFNLLNPGFGILRKGHTYDVALDDARTAQNPDHEFPLDLVVTGDLPPA